MLTTTDIMELAEQYGIEIPRQTIYSLAKKLVKTGKATHDTDGKWLFEVKPVFDWFFGSLTYHQIKETIDGIDFTDDQKQ